MIDLHTHTSHSDGTFSPEELVQLAIENDLSALAITDHDTINGIEPAMYEANGKVEIIPGVELSVKADLPGTGHLHILGLFIDHTDQNLITNLDYLSSKRIDRLYAIIDKLNELNLEISTDDLHLEGDHGSIGRPHIARILVNHGYVKSIREAFDLYLGKGQPAYVAKECFTSDEAIKLIHEAGGLAVLAHPVSLGFPDLNKYKDYIGGLIEIGLDGLEAYSAFHSPEFTNGMYEFAEAKKICISGGSDFHGANKSEITLGRGLGNLAVPDVVLEELKKNLVERQ